MNISPENLTIYYLIALLKAYKIKNIVASSGMQNAQFNSLVQNDEDFNCYSVVDERSAGYFATGISFETGAPVVITCTGATSSRNYLSSLTEAYYRKIPLIAITFFNPTHNKFNLSPQYVDRSITQNDIKYISVELPLLHSNTEKQQLLTKLNAALCTAVYQKCPVHINCPSSTNFKDEYELPQDIWKTEFYDYNFEELKNDIKNKKTAVFIGAHSKFTKEEENAVQNFACSYDIPVICDHSANYHGTNKILTSQLMQRLKNMPMPEIIIDMGSISGDYSLAGLFKNAKIWRISPDSAFLCRQNRPLEKLFSCSEQYFFELLKNDKEPENHYFSELNEKIKQLDIPEIPLSNLLICQYLSKYLPKNSSLHLAILNSFRCMNFFNLDNSIDVNCNVGGFGIDGAVSTVVGQSVALPNKKVFGLIGDLAFYYDMNALGLRQIKNNLRIILVNNNGGEEFRLNHTLFKRLGENINPLIAAADHYRNSNGCKHWAEACGFEYLQASTKDEFINLIQDFCNKDSDKPILFEVFTEDENERASLGIIRNTLERKKNKSPIKKIKELFSGKK